MQLLIAKTALARIATRLAAIAPDLDVIAMTPSATFERGGQGIPASQVEPDIAWIPVDAVYEGWVPAAFDTLLASGSLTWVQTFSAGLDRPAFRQLIGKGVRVSKSNAQAAAIAEYVTGHVFSLILPIAQQRLLQEARQWKTTPFREISDTRWTLVGFGAIGAEIAGRVKAFGAHLTVVRRQSGDRGLADAVVAMEALGHVLPETDVVVLACALNAQTRHVANAGFFGKLKRGAILINIGRGALVDNEAMRAGLDRDQPAHAVLDVFDEEPLPAGDWRWGHPQVRVSAHTSAYGSGTMRRGDELFLENLKRLLGGQPLLNLAVPAEVGL